MLRFCRGTQSHQVGDSRVSPRVQSGRIATLVGLLALWTAVGAQERAGRAPLQVRVSEGMVRLTLSDSTDIRFAHLSRSQGLSQTRVTRIVQDNQGFIWLATQY